MRQPTSAKKGIYKRLNSTKRASPSRDISFEGDYEDVTSIQYEIFNKGEKPVRISEVKCNKGRRCVIGEPINIKVKSSGGTKPLYKFVVYKDGRKKEKIE